MRTWLPSLVALGLAPLFLHCASPGPVPAQGQAPVVLTDRGPVRGLSYVGGGHAFLGIPFAAAPVGNLRFRPPQPPAPWTEPLDASRPGSICLQAKSFLSSAGDQSEDCLRLNVWTPSLDPSARAPVMVFLHGGSFVFGSGSMETYHGNALSAAGAVVVTINYRLGSLGFLAHPALTAEDEHHSSGNYGLLDQQRALEWIRDNISRFGGAPDNITLFGESAGAISTCLQTVSPLAQGLFHKAIAESGSCDLIHTPLHDPGTPQEDSAEEHGVHFAREVGCTEGDIAACLRARTPAELIDAQQRIAKNLPIDLLRPPVGFIPNVDGYVIPALPRTLRAEGRHARLPLLVGTNGEEGTLFTKFLPIKLDTPQEYEEAVRGRAPEQAEPLLRLFPLKDFASPRDAYNHLLRDAVFLCPARRFARDFAAHGQPVYLYQFTFDYTPHGMLSWLLPSGSFHSAELPFVFGATRGPFTLDTPREKELSARMIGDWTRFAHSGDPNGGSAPVWPRFTLDSESYLILDTSLRTGEHPEPAHCDALDALGI